MFNREGIPLFSFDECGPFYTPYGVVIDSINKVLVCDCENHIIQVFSTEGQFLHKIRTRGVGLGQFTCPLGIAVSPKGHLYVSDHNGHRVQVFQLC